VKCVLAIKYMIDSTAKMTTVDLFPTKVKALRHDYSKKRNTPLFEDAGEKIIGFVWHRQPPHCEIWYSKHYIRICDSPGKLSGDILRLNSAIPSHESPSIEINGDNITPLIEWPEYVEEEFEDDSEELDSVINKLPIIADMKSDIYFTKECKYKSEIRNLLKCQGGSCPGIYSGLVIQLLGRTVDNHLVFPRLRTLQAMLHQEPTLANFKKWILELIDGLNYIHGLGIVHRDLRIDNLLYDPDKDRIIICDLEGRWGQYGAPEIVMGAEYEQAGWTERSDIFELGWCIRCMVYQNNPVIGSLDWPVPEPLDELVNSCNKADPAARPTLAELREIVRKIQT
jgi:hypothetical protein